MIYRNTSSKRTRESSLSTRGFSLIEIMAVIFIMGLLITLVVPNFRNFRPGYERKSFFNDLNQLTATAWHRALQNQKAYRIFFDMKKKLVALQNADGSEEKIPALASLPASLQKNSIVWPPSLEIKDFFINGKNDMANRSRSLTTIWFYITEQGIAQEVIINGQDTSHSKTDNPVEFGLILNPFNAQFKEYDSFQKP